MFEIPPDLNPALAGLAWLRGRWEGTGYREWPGEGKTEFGVQIDFVENGGDYLHYLAQMFTLDGEGRPEAPLTIETGFWRGTPEGQVDVVMCSPEGYAEIWYGPLSPGRVDLTTVADPDSDVTLSVAFPGDVTSTNGERVASDIVQWKLKPGVVSTMKAQARYTDPSARSFTTAAIWMAVLAFAVAGVIGGLAYWSRDRSPKFAAVSDE